MRVLLLFLFVFFLLAFLFFLFSFLCYSEKNRWRLFVFAGDAALKVPASPKRRVQNLQDFSPDKKPTPEKGAAAALLLLRKTNTSEG